MITDAQLDDFCAKVQAMQTHGEVISYERLRKYVRVISEYGSQRGVWCFIDPANGDILKAASWKAPAKTARGNIATGTQGCCPLGPNYLV